MFKINLVNLPSPLKIKMDYKFPEVLPVKLQKKEVQPRTVSQLVYPDSGFNGLSEVSVNAVTKDIDENIKSENIKKDVSILGVQGNIEELKGTKLEITKNGTYSPEEPYNAYTEVDVNTDDVSEYYTSSYKYGRAIISIKKVPLLPIQGSSAYHMFQGFQALTEVPLLDTSNITDMNGMFYNCYALASLPLLDTSKVTMFSETFYNCYSIKEFPKFSTDSATSFYYTFYRCNRITSLHLLNSSKVTNVNGMFSNCLDLTNLDGLQNLGQAYLTTQSANYSNYTLNLSACTKLTHDSLMNVINNLYDIATKGCNTQKLSLGSTNVAKLTVDEIAIATNKGWTVS